MSAMDGNEASVPKTQDEEMEGRNDSKFKVLAEGKELACVTIVLANFGVEQAPDPQNNPNEAEAGVLTFDFSTTAKPKSNSRFARFVQAHSQVKRESDVVSQDDIGSKRVTVGEDGKDPVVGSEKPLCEQSGVVKEGGSGKVEVESSSLARGAKEEVAVHEESCNSHEGVVVEASVDGKLQQSPSKTSLPVRSEQASLPRGSQQSPLPDSSQQSPLPENSQQSPLPENSQQSPQPSFLDSPSPDSSLLHPDSPAPARPSFLPPGSLDHIRQLHSANRRQSILFDMNHAHKPQAPEPVANEKSPSQQLLSNTSVVLPASLLQRLKTDGLKYTEADMLIERKRVAIESKKESEEALAVMEDMLKKHEKKIVCVGEVGEV